MANIKILILFFNKENNIRKDIFKNIKWFNDKDEFLKLYDKIIKNGEFSVNTKDESISLNIFKNFFRRYIKSKH